MLSASRSVATCALSNCVAKSRASSALPAALASSTSFSSILMRSSAVCLS